MVSKGPVAREISPYALVKLQQAFMYYALDISYFKRLAIFPNEDGDQTFANFFFVLQAMRGEHALRPHNRQFYYNAVLNKFEPIYYDGNLALHQKVDFDDGYAYFNQDVIDVALHGVHKEILIKIRSLSNNLAVKDKFKDRTLLEDKSAEHFFDLATLTLVKNAIVWSNIDHSNKTKGDPNPNQPIEAYFERQKSLGVDQLLVRNFEVAEHDYLLQLHNGNEMQVTPNEFASIVSKPISTDRVVLVPISIEGKDYMTQNTELHDSKAVIICRLEWV